MPSDRLQAYDLHFMKDLEASQSSFRYDEPMPRGEFYYLLLGQIIPEERGTIGLYLQRINDTTFSRQGSVLMTNPYSTDVWDSESVRRTVIEII